MKIDRSILVENGWEQGRIFQKKDHAELFQRLNFTLGVDDCCVVVSQSCDLLHETLDDEPFAEVIVARPLATPTDLQFQHSRNPRRLHFPITVAGEEVDYEVVPANCGRVPREILLHCIADNTRCLSDKARECLVTWLIRRYSRPALPDNFNTRIKSTEKTLRDILKKAPSLRGLYVALKPIAELDRIEEPYTVAVVALMAHSDYRNNRLQSEVTQKLDKFVARLKACGGIKVTDYQVMSDAQLTLAQLDKLLELDYEYLTLRDPKQRPAVRRR